MARILVVSILSGLLSSCAGMPEWALIVPSKSKQGIAAVSHYSFAWRLSGDRAVAPIQAFDNGNKTWLQFPPQRPLPAVFEHTAAGDRPLKYTQEGPYMVLDGVWPQLVLRGGRLQSRVERLLEPGNEAVTAAVSSDQPGTPPITASAMPMAVPSEALPATPPVNTPVIAPVLPADFSAAAKQSAPAAPLPSLALQAAANAVALPVAGASDASVQHFAVSPKDLNLRSALARWAKSAGWTFEPEHWAVDADIPIVASATFEPGFKLAVQDLVASTELADRPLQPCFYSNRVLRIVPYAQQCDRTVSGAGAS